MLTLYYVTFRQRSFNNHKQCNGFQRSWALFLNEKSNANYLNKKITLWKVNTSVSNQSYK